MSMHFSRSTWAPLGALASLLLLAPACGGDDPKPEADAPEASSEPAGEAPEAAPAADSSTKIDFVAAASRAKTAMFVPAPSEFQIALAAANVESNLADKLGDDSALDGKSKPVVALETGRRIANVLLASKGGAKDDIIARMKSAREGLQALGADGELLGDIDKAIADFTEGKVSQDELPPVMDLLNQKVQKGLRSGASEETATLVQAGGWVQGVHLLSGALAEGDKGADAAALVHQPAVLSYFSNFIQNTSAAKAGDEDVKIVIDEMKAMGEIASKDALTSEDLALVSKHTGNIIARF